MFAIAFSERSESKVDPQKILLMLILLLAISHGLLRRCMAK